MRAVGAISADIAKVQEWLALVPFDVIRSCIIVLDVTAMEGHDLS
jgi:hypothetical protein